MGETGMKESLDRANAQPTGWMTRRYLIALSAIALLAVAAFTAFQELIAAHERTLAVVNISGRQRMLSQRIALLVHRLAVDDCTETRADCVARLREAVDLFETSHRGLAHGSATFDIPGPTSPTVERLYFEQPAALDDRVRRYIAAARTVAEAEPDRLHLDHPAVAHILREGPGPLLAALDAAVLAYQHDGERALARLRLMEFGVLGLTLFTLVLEALFIFRPMVRRLTHQFETIRSINSGLRDSNETLEQRVDERTRELAVAKAEAEQATRAKSRFLAAASHDMLQPLEAAEMFTGLLGREVTTERGRALVSDLHKAQRSLRHLVGSVLDVSRLDAGVIKPVMGPVAVGPLLYAIAGEFGPLALSRELRLGVVGTSLWCTPMPTFWSVCCVTSSAMPCATRTVAGW